MSVIRMVDLGLRGIIEGIDLSVIAHVVELPFQPIE